MPEPDFELIDVPYRSQWDADAALSRGDCGIVSAAMVANWRGIDVTPDALLRQSKLPVGRLTYTFGEIILAANGVGLALKHHSPATWAQIRAELDAGRPVISLLRYSEISGNQDDFQGAHFWVVVGYEADYVIVNDPDWWQPRRSEGHQRRVPVAEFEAAIGAALKPTGNNPYQSLFLA